MIAGVSSVAAVSFSVPSAADIENPAAKVGPGLDNDLSLSRAFPISVLRICDLRSRYLSTKSAIDLC